MARIREIDLAAIGRRICLQRKKLKLSQERLAEYTDISSSFVGAIERGEKIPAVDTLARLAKCLDTSLDYLVFGIVNTCDKAQCSLYTDIMKVVESHTSYSKQRGTNYEYEQP